MYQFYKAGNLVAHVRMDGAWIGSIDISIKKAYTSRAFNQATKDLAEQSQSGGQFFGIHASNNGKIMIFAGGIPLYSEGLVVGELGLVGVGRARPCRCRSRSRPILILEKIIREGIR
ncbi:heme-binding protein [Okeania sp. KiyG1]|uniref:GlcG/HbpS family heme-binding protein n=1 Tax=Okeania sp. KiyG1 TaxID=2720165 RepID=UPI0035C8DAFB